MRVKRSKKLLAYLATLCLLALLPANSQSKNTEFSKNFAGISKEFQADFRKNPVFLQKELDCVQTALWFEARGEGLQGMKNVLAVLQNRVQAKGFPSSYCAVVLQKQQFSFVQNGKIPRITARLQERKVLAKVQELAYNAVIRGEQMQELPKTVLHYAKYNVRPSWAIKARLYKRVGQHNFYIV